MTEHSYKNRSVKQAYWLCLAVIGMVYVALVLLRHLSFETHGHDLGIFDQGAWHYSRWEVPFSSIKGYSLLGDHFTPILALVGPLYWLWNGPETLLVWQVVIGLSGTWPAYQIGRRYLGEGYLALYPAVFYALFYGVQASLDFDFHTDGLAAAFFMWAIWQWESERRGWYLLCLGLVLLCKETMPVYLCFWAGYMWLSGRARWLHAGLAVGSILLFLIELNLVLPWLAGRPYYYTDYGLLGQSMGEVVVNSIKNPLLLGQALFGEPVKLESWLVFLVASGGALLIRPGLLLMLIPNVIERFLNPQPPRWSLYFHYSVILTPFLTLAVVLALARYQTYQGKVKPSRKLVELWLAIVLLLNSLVFSNFLWHGFTNMQYLDQPNTRQALKLIPPEASVLANSRLVPHLTHRAQVDELLSPEPPHPELRADYVIISLEVERNSTDRQALQTELDHFLVRSDYRILFQQGQVWVFRRSIG